MSGSLAWSWLGLFALGAGHGLNPGMGWLFAVALGLQQRRARAVWRALPPLALGHALAVGLVVAAAAGAGVVLAPRALRWGVAVLLVGMGVYRIVRRRHPRYGGMRVGARDLTVWSFLMASAHGAGLMVLPLVLGMPAASGEAHPMPTAMMASVEAPGAWATVFHTTGYLVVTAVLAAVVYRRVGLRLLRSMWVNLDLVWAFALILTGLATPLM